LKSNVLSPREWEVLALVAHGHSNKAIAHFLFIALSTVKTHVNEIFDKLGVRTRTEAAVWYEKMDSPGRMAPDARLKSPDRADGDAGGALPSDRPLLIYVSGPYTAHTEGGRLDNTHAAIADGMAIYARGQIPVIPHLTHLIPDWIRQNPCYRPMEWEDYLTWDLVILERCDALLRRTNPFGIRLPSAGADLEEAYAEQWRKPILLGIDQVPIFPYSPAAYLFDFTKRPRYAQEGRAQDLPVPAALPAGAADSPP
jgi:DNA-binding CsgD family transcriptional regulator